jgi:hypothetical protein
MVHAYKCVVHEPNSVHLSQSYFKKPPNKVTEENKCFWSKDIEVGGSICKKCLFMEREKREKVEKSEKNKKLVSKLY